MTTKRRDPTPQPGLDEIVRSALAIGSQAGVDDVEVALLESFSTQINVSEGDVETLEEQHDRGVGIRVWCGRRAAFGFTNDLSPAALKKTAETARDLAAFTASDEAHGPAEPIPSNPEPRRNSDPGLASFPVQRKIALAQAVERSARGLSPEVDRVRKACYRDLAETWRVANSRGLDATTFRTRAWLSIEAAARRNGDQRSGSYADWALGPQCLDPERVGRTGAFRAVEMLGARAGRSGRPPVVLDRETTAALIDALGDSFSGLRALRQRTVLEGKVGEKIGSPKVTLIDDATLEGAWGMTPFDGEGTPTSRRTVIDEGRFCSFLHDQFTARRMGVSPTGHALRTSFSTPPGIHHHNLHLRPTGETRQELLAAAEGGLFLTQLIGLHTVNATTGDFSLGAVGRKILAGGELGPPVDQIAVSGSVFSLLDSFVAVADDLEFLMGGAGGSSVLLREMTIAGS